MYIDDYSKNVAWIQQEIDTEKTDSKNSLHSIFHQAVAIPKTDANLKKSKKIYLKITELHRQFNQELGNNKSNPDHKDTVSKIRNDIDSLKIKFFTKLKNQSHLTTAIIFPVHSAIRTNDLLLLQKLIEGGADINQKNENGLSPFELAVVRENFEVASFLIDKMIEKGMLNHRNKYTPLEYAIFQRNCRISAYLIEKGADVNTTTPGGDSLISLSIKQHRIENTKLLIEKVDHLDCALIFLALVEHDPEVAEILIEKIWNPADELNGQKLLQEALDRKMPGIASLLIKKGCKFPLLNERSEPLLCQAIALKSLELVNFLIDERSINLPDKMGYSPLILALKNQSFDIAKTLIDKRCDMHCVDPAGNNPLHHILNRITNNEMAQEITQRLMTEKNILEKNKDGKTALHFAALNGLKEVIRVLLSKGCNIDQQDNEGRTPLYCALSKRATDAAEFLIGEGADCHKVNNNGEGPLIRAIKTKQEKIALALIEKGCDVTVCDRSGDTLFHLALKKAMPKVFEKLKEKGVLPFQKTRRVTPHWFLPSLMVCRKWQRN